MVLGKLRNRGYKAFSKTFGGARERSNVASNYNKNKR